MAEDKVQYVEAEVIDGFDRFKGPGSVRIGKAGKPKRFSRSLLFSGVLFILLGIVCIAWPGLALETMAIIIGVGLLVGGIGSIIDFAWSGGLRLFSGWLLASGIIELLMGIMFVVRPLGSMVALSVVVAVSIIVVGAFQLLSAWGTHGHGGRSWLFELLTGIVTVLFGILMLMQPASLVWWVAGFSIVLGVALAVLAFRVPKVLGL